MRNGSIGEWTMGWASATTLTLLLLLLLTLTLTLTPRQERMRNGSMHRRVDDGMGQRNHYNPNSKPNPNPDRSMDARKERRILTLFFLLGPFQTSPNANPNPRHPARVLYGSDRPVTDFLPLYHHAARPP